MSKTMDELRTVIHTTKINNQEYLEELLVEKAQEESEISQLISLLKKARKILREVKRMKNEQYIKEMTKMIEDMQEALYQTKQQYKLTLEREKLIKKSNRWVKAGEIVVKVFK